MKIDLTAPAPATWKPITCPAGKFEVAVVSPTYEQQGMDIGGERWLLNRIESVITDWRGVNDGDDKPIPFHFKSVAILCQQFPTVFNQLAAIANEAYRGLSADESKNSEPPSNES